MRGPGADGDHSSSIYRLAAAASAGIVVLTPGAIAVFAAWPPPYDGTAADWFDLFEDSWLLGLLSMDLLFIGVLVLNIPVLIGLYVALQETHPGIMATAVVFGFLGLGLQLSSITAFEMLALSERYADATSDAEKAVFLAAGEATLATYEGTAFQLNYLFGGTIVPLAISFVMLKSSRFGVAIPYVGAAASLMNLGLYVPSIGLLLSVLAGGAFWLWYVLLAVKFLHFSRTASVPLTR